MYLSGMEGIFSGSPFPSPDGSQMERSGDVAGEWEALAVSSPRPSGGFGHVGLGKAGGLGQRLRGKGCGRGRNPGKARGKGNEGA